jgi:hypothetical protein
MEISNRRFIEQIEAAEAAIQKIEHSLRAAHEVVQQAKKMLIDPSKQSNGIGSITTEQNN